MEKSLQQSSFTCRKPLLFGWPHLFSPFLRAVLSTPPPPKKHLCGFTTHGVGTLPYVPLLFYAQWGRMLFLFPFADYLVGWVDCFSLLICDYIKVDICHLKVCNHFVLQTVWICIFNYVINLYGRMFISTYSIRFIILISLE